MNTYKSIFSSLFLFLLVFHDYFFLNFFDLFGSYFFLNLWKEMLVVIYLFCVFIVLPILKNQNKILLSKKIVPLFFVSVIIFLIWGGGAESSIKTFRSLVMPLYMSFIIVDMTNQCSERNKLQIFKFCCFLFFLVALYGFYQTISVKNTSDVWYYDLLTAQGFELKEWDIFRKGNVRISSFFTSSLDFAFFILLALVTYLAYFKIYRKTLSNIVFFGGGIIFLTYIILISSVRTGQIGLIICLINYIYIIMCKNKKNIFWFGLISSSCIIIFTFYYLGSGYSDDLSALGRIVQWGTVYNLVLSQPMGMGLAYVGPSEDVWFDSFLLNCFATMGLFSFFIIGFILVSYKLIANMYCKMVHNDFLSTLGLILMVYFPAFIYIIFFQAIYNSAVMYFFCIYASIFFLSKKPSNTK